MNYYNLGTKALNNGKYEKALAYFRKEPDKFKELYLNIGSAHLGMNNFGLAINNFLKANDINLVGMSGSYGEYDMALGNLGLAYYAVWEDKLAKYYYEKALCEHSMHPNNIWNYSIALLRIYCSGAGKAEGMWEAYRSRFKTVATDITSGVPMWDGSKQDTITVVSEQGYGDKLMFSRYLDRAAARCNKMYVVVPPSMKDLYSEYNILYKKDEGLPEDCGLIVPMGDLAGVFGDESNGDWLKNKYERKLSSDKFRVAIEWSGSDTHANNHNRSCPERFITKLTKLLPDVEFVNVRPDSKKIKGVTKLNSADWNDSANHLTTCDMVVSVDTSIVHLAGSMGIPCLLMQPLFNTDFRWGSWKLKLETGMPLEDNIWYNSVKVLENPGWDKLITQIASILEVARDKKKQ